MDDETVAVYDAKFQDYADLVKTSKPSASLLRFINAVSQGGRVLDFGCGPGAASKTMAVSGLQVTALDASEGMISLVREIPNVTAVQADFSWLNQSNAYEGVWANFALLHASREDFATYLDAIVEALSPNGILHLGMKTGAGEKRDTLGRRYAYFTRSEFEMMLLERDFEILHVKEGEDMSLAGEMDPFVMILARRLV